MNDMEIGTVKLHFFVFMEERGLSLSKLSFRAEMQRTQLKHYIDGSIQRLDIAVLSRLCYALECDLQDLLEYIPPSILLIFQERTYSHLSLFSPFIISHGDT